MARGGEGGKPQRFLLKRGGTYYYYRRVPAEVASMDRRAPYVRQTLKTGDFQKAMALRDIYERADNEFWASLMVGSESDVAVRRYKAAVARATALGFAYKTASEIAAQELPVSIVERIEAAASTPKKSPEKVAVYGLAGDADHPISYAIDYYISVIARASIRNKSREQKRIWENIKRAPVATFIDLCGDKKMSDIGGDDARKFYKFWLDRVAPESGKPTHTVSIANKHLDGLRILFREWNKHHGRKDAPNPFDGLRFSEKKSLKRKRPPFSVDWIRTKFLVPGPLANLNPQARGVFLAMVETGARLSEICNLREDKIILDCEYPYIIIEPSEDPDDPREIKTESSIRIVPLVGVSLAALTKNRKGFPRYRDKGSGLSSTINKFLRENNLLETPRHKVYSLRHSFEDRMKNVGLDTELRMMLMGHSIDRPSYGEGGSLEWRYKELSKIVLPFDKSIV